MSGSKSDKSKSQMSFKESQAAAANRYQFFHYQGDKNTKEETHAKLFQGFKNNNANYVRLMIQA